MFFFIRIIGHKHFLTQHTKSKLNHKKREIIVNGIRFLEVKGLFSMKS